MAVPTAVPSILICTLLIAVSIVEMLSRAHPLTVTTPFTTVPGAGVSMNTNGRPAGTVMFTLAVPTSGVPSVSVAETVIVCEPALSGARLS